MTTERWALLKSLFDQALDLEGGERVNFVRAACAGDETLERSLAGLLNHHEAASSVLAGPMLTPERMAEIVSSGLRTFVPGEIVAGRFRIQQFLAEGGMGEVYAAEDLELNETVALKTIRPVLASDGKVLAGFKQEIQLARKVTHRNVSRVFDLFHHEIDLDGLRRTIVFLSMELLRGETLAERIHRLGPFRPDEAQCVATQLIAGLDAAHSAGIIHSDFKSGNVALVPEPEGQGGERVVIMDFGLAGTQSSLCEVGRAGLRGTPAYVAPEQVENGAITPATDIYALGVVLFEMISGTLPFQGGSPKETAELRLRRDAPTLRTVAPDAPPVWERTIGACLQRDPAKRPVSAGEVRARMTGLYERRRKLRAMALGICAAGLIAGGAYWARLPHRPAAAAQAAADSARVKLENNTTAGLREAIDDYRRAIQLDPKWAQAWAELAYTYATGANAKQVPAGTASGEARAAALQAIRLDDRSTKAFGVLGWVQSLDFDEWPKAEANLRRALALNSGDAQVHYWLGVHLRKKGKFADAEAEDRQGLTLSHQADPAIWCELAFLYWTSGQLDRMEQFMKEQLVAYPNFGLTRFLHARLLKEQGKFDEALAELRFAESLQYTTVTVLAEHASVEACRGNTAEARADLLRLREASKTQPVDGLLMAGVYAKLGDFDSAFELLDRGYAQRDSTLLSVATSPVLKPLHGDPRFAALLRRLHFEP
jgi:tetratricopeptide (TPR) repeat protein